MINEYLMKIEKDCSTPEFVIDAVCVVANAALPSLPPNQEGGSCPDPNNPSSSIQVFKSTKALSA